MKWKFSIMLIILVLFSLSAVCAADVDNSTVNNYDYGTLSADYQDSVISDDEKPDIPDLVVDDKKHVYQSNINLYFKNGVLKKEFKGDTLVFSGNFDNLGVLTITSNDVNIVGENAYLKNTVFNIQSNGITLKNLSFDLDKSIRDNNGAAIQVNGYDVTLDSLDINYVVPNDVEAYAILSDGLNGYSSENLKIVNSNISFEGHNDNVFKYNCVIKLTYANAPIIENNTISSSFPLKKVQYGTNGATLDSDYVYAIGLEQCPDFIIKNNTIIVDVNKRTAVEYPTLNAIMLSKSDNGSFLNNSLFMTDFVTPPGIENYIYGLDIHNLNDLLIKGNKISIFTTGGKLALGTAYPIQVSGPASGVNITQNDLYSFSNGPNIGIYSQNYYGETQISITNNKINVTGLAGTHEWALVTGIESQDTNSEILNNIIEVHSIDAVNEDDNLYAISYRQSTADEHTFNIQNNIAFTDGYYAVYLLSSDNSIINDNTLISFNENALSGSDSYHEGPREHNNDESSNNVVINARDYYGYQNTININSYENYGIFRYIDGRNIGVVSPNEGNHNYNPLIPGILNPIGGESGTGNDYQDDGSIQGTLSNEHGSSLKPTNLNDLFMDSSDNSNRENIVYSNDYGAGESNGFSANANSNSSDTPSIGTDNPLSKSPSSSSNAESHSVSKAYELNRMNKEEFIPSVFFVIMACLLLVIGYKKRDTDFE
ncbi:MAG: hypothetical protein II396_02435 [Methanobrevibacter sp.]|nr:hypothetical protein [Methanobrevibacter sp.]